jgi:uncharacterized protein (TIGR03435 family)
LRDVPASENQAGNAGLHKNAACRVWFDMKSLRPTLTIFLTASLVVAQSSRRFDLATIKTYAAHDGNFMIRPLPGGTFRAVGVTLKMLMMWAYNVKSFQIPDAPGWVGADLWDIQAKAEGVEGRLSREDSQAMVRNWFEDRYQLKLHRETRNMPVYVLLAIRPAGNKLVTASGQEQAGICPCGLGSLSPSRATMKMLADQLSTQLWRVVVDKTQLTGEYSFRLHWTPAQGEYGPEALGLPPRAAAEPPPSVIDNGPSIFTALQEQLGLRLVSQNGTVEVLVIDHAEKPDAN